MATYQVKVDALPGVEDHHKGQVPPKKQSYRNSCLSVPCIAQGKLPRFTLTFRAFKGICGMISGWRARSKQQTIFCLPYSLQPSNSLGSVLEAQPISATWPTRCPPLPPVGYVPSHRFPSLTYDELPLDLVSGDLAILGGHPHEPENWPSADRSMDARSDVWAKASGFLPSSQHLQEKSEGEAPETRYQVFRLHPLYPEILNLRTCQLATYTSFLPFSVSCKGSCVTKTLILCRHLRSDGFPSMKML